ncbi:MAG: hypothetical protein GY803_23755 [Chloroflexi bacterium]|nr:hypothetical protein [Chloroflexota bacterium]
MNDTNGTMYYKVSYVILGGAHTGAIFNVDQRPEVGGKVSFDNNVFEIVEVMELMPPVSNFAFLHATCKFLHEAGTEESQ